jgi:uncharacterized membrane protein YphA (DoxX/SURF4 family)
MKMKILLRLLLAAVFAAAGLSKALYPETFRAFLAGIKIFESDWIPLFTQLVSTCEIGLAVVLATGWHPRYSALLTAVILALFTIVQLAVPLLAGKASSCGCFAFEILSEYEQSLAFRIARNLVLLAAAIMLYRIERKIRAEKGRIDESSADPATT